ncbi:mitogen-activated protein kinase [Acrasis kona]|uniref:Mitogen-activated protein kinase n=1 Tax=Acrasis kona TaxID=1008807 RepID=A0AAW2ZL09_9EUKA
MSTSEQQPNICNVVHKQILKEHRIQNETFLLPQRYVPKRILGKGAYGTVVEAKDKEANEKVAIKKNNKVFSKSDTNILVPKRVLREMKILDHLNHPNIVRLKGVVLPKNYEEFESVTLVTDLMETDLRSILKSRQTLSDRHIQYIMFQLIAALNYTHSASILHRDLKPANILINADSKIKLCDFGLARFIDFEGDPTMSTNYVQTRWYRAPELLLNYGQVSKQADMWSVGCIFAEMILGRPILTGSSPVNQIEKIVTMLGTPKPQDIRGSSEGVEFMKRLRFREARPLAELFPTVKNPHAIDLLSKLLVFNPEHRLSAAEAIKHPYMSQFYDEAVIFTCPSKFNYDFEDRLTDIKSVKMETYATMLSMSGVSKEDIEQEKAQIDSRGGSVMDSLRSMLGMRKSTN